MKCSSVREKLFDYIDGVLEGSNLREFEDHLKSCSECRDELEKVRQLDAQLRQDIPAYLESIEPAPAFLNRLKHLELEPTPAKTAGFWDSLLSVFQEHRMAWGTGLAILLVVALSFAIPTITQNGDDDDTQMIAEAPTPGEESERAPTAAQEPTEGLMEMDESSSVINKSTDDEFAAPVQTATPGDAPAEIEPVEAGLTPNSAVLRTGDAFSDALNENLASDRVGIYARGEAGN